MKKGKILTNPLIRSVLRWPFPQKEERALARDGAVLGDKRCGAAINTGVYSGPHAEALSFCRSLNSALAAGILPDSVMLSLLLPERETEPVLSSRMQRLQELAERENLAICGGSTAVSANCSSAVITAVISGKFAEGYEDGPKLQEGMALLVTGFLGEAGTGVLVQEEEDRLSRRFSRDFLQGAEICEERLSVRPAAEILRDEQAVMHDISEGGIFSALYTFSEGHGCGFRVRQRDLPIRQETVEICNELDINPYEMLSTGALLAAVKDADRALLRLHDAGIPAVCVGEVISGRQKLLLRGDEIRHLERPAQDPLMRLPNFG